MTSRSLAGPTAAIRTLLLSGLLAGAFFTGPASAAVQEGPQVGCVNALNRVGANLMRQQAKVNRDCVRYAADGRIDRLGTPPQEQTASACLSNDVRGRVAATTNTVINKDARSCLARSEQRPGFAYAGGDAITDAGILHGRAWMADVFGTDLDAAIRSEDTDSTGARCQQELTRRGGDLLHMWWREARRALKDALRGRNRLTGAGPVTSALELRDEVLARLDADTRARLTNAQQKLADKISQRCDETTTPIASMFPGACAAAADLGELASCTGALVRARFYRAIDAFDFLQVPCDRTDDGEVNASCEGPDLTGANVVILLADDLGWGDVGYHSTGDPFTTIPTPHIDQIAAEGMKLEQFLAQPVCSPTRAELLTGRSAIRVGVAPVTINERAGQHMPLSEITLGEAFGNAGYATALMGKWHLGGDAHGPLVQGFDDFHGILDAATDYFTRADDDGTEWQQNGTYVTVPGYTTDIIADDAVTWIAGHAGDPFFLYVPFTAPHNPQQAKTEDIARVPPGFDPSRTTYAAMVISLDDAIGRILDELEAQGVAGNTIVVFASDNGGGQPGNNLPLAGNKGSTYDGGVRVPAAMRIPGVSNGTVRSMLAAADLYPTLLSMTGVDAPAGPPLDGADRTAEIVNAAVVGARTEAGWVRFGVDAYRTPEWKLLRRVDGDIELYDLLTDPYETTDLAATMPSTANTLETALDAWNAYVGCVPSHVPPPSSAPAPSGDVIRVIADMGPAASGDILTIRIDGTLSHQVHPGDKLEFDMKIEPGSRTNGIVVDLGNTNADLWDDRDDVRDQDGHDVASGETFTAAVGSWARRTIGLSIYGTDIKGQLKLAFTDLSPGHYEILLDNIVIRGHDGTDVVVYADGPVPDPSIFDDDLTDVTASISAEAL